jgi:hypothetical protein
MRPPPLLVSMLTVIAVVLLVPGSKTVRMRSGARPCWCGVPDAPVSVISGRQCCRSPCLAGQANRRRTLIGRLVDGYTAP